VLSLDEKTSLQPRTRTSRNRPAQPSNKPVVVEHEYVRKGALNLFAAFDTRTDRVVGASHNCVGLKQYATQLNSDAPGVSAAANQAIANCTNRTK
jgi:hypothetical protein